MITSNLEDIQRGQVRYYGPQHGVVRDVEDPEGLHRVRAEIPGLVELTDWAWPRTAGGGGPQRGGHVVPRVGDDVVVEFVGGDPNGKVLYSGGMWGRTAAGSETPSAVREKATPAEAARVQSLEVDGLRITVDENEGKRRLEVLDPVTGDAILLDRERGAIMIQATSAVVIKAIGLVSIEGAQVTINGRPVTADSKPIA